MSRAASAWLLEVEDLHVHFVTSRGVVRAVEGISYQVKAGEVVALVGESGCGKSVSSLAIMRLLAKPAGRIVGGRVLFQGRDLLQLSEEQMREIRGRDIAMIFQEPMTSLNPVLTIGFQIMEPLQIHLGMDEAAARARALELLKLVGIPDPERRLDQYPHQFSGGMRQRVMIAIGLSCNPKLLIADEPTTALDVTIQAQILKLMKDLSRELGIALVIITHNLGVVARYADRVNVMYSARIAEQGAAREIFARPLHPYTAGLLRSVPRLDQPRGRKLETIDGMPPNLLDPPIGCRFAPRCPAQLPVCTAAPPPLLEVETAHWTACVRGAEMAQVGPVGLGLQSANPQPPAAKSIDAATPLLHVHDLRTYFDVSTGMQLLKPARSVVRAVDGLSFAIQRGETVGLVGESGCGKTTVGRTLLRLENPTAGRIVYDGADVTHAQGDQLKQYRRQVQVIFQDPYSSLNPRMTIGQIIAEPMLVYGLEPDRTRGRRQGRAAAYAGRPLRLHGRTLSARVVGRPAPARRHRARARDAAEPHRVRRAGVGARRVDPGADHEPARRTPARVQAHVFVHRPRSCGGAPHFRSRDRDVSRQGDGNRRPRRALQRTAASLH